MSFEPEVTAKVVSASLQANGELRRDVLSDAVARAALLVDLALDARLPRTMMIDTTATGFDPTDHLLLAVEADPARSLSWWLSHAPVRAADVAQDFVGRGAWMVTQRSLGRAARYRPPEFAYGRTEMTERLRRLRRLPRAKRHRPVRFGGVARRRPRDAPLSPLVPGR